MKKLFLSGVVEVEDDFTPGDCETCRLYYENYDGEGNCIFDFHEWICPITIDKNNPGILYLDVK